MTTESNNFSLATQKGVDQGLFQTCMKAIRAPHHKANKLRLGLIVVGLFTDKNIYRQVIAIFYTLTKELERKLQSLPNDPICATLLALDDYKFTKGYEQDLKFLYSESEDWKEELGAAFEKNPAAMRYFSNLRSMTSGAQLAGAAFCLWGALVIGGGAVAQPRVASAFGKEATHVFQSVIGPGREKRKKLFVEIWDTLALKDTKEFQECVQATKECMQANNHVLGSMECNPWWLGYAKAAAVAIVSMLVIYVTAK